MGSGYALEGVAKPTPVVPSFPDPAEEDCRLPVAHADLAGYLGDRVAGRKTMIMKSLTPRKITEQSGQL